MIAGMYQYDSVYKLKEDYYSMLCLSVCPLKHIACFFATHATNPGKFIDFVQVQVTLFNNPTEKKKKN